jgi:anti-sigma factor RsiW
MNANRKASVEARLETAIADAARSPDVAISNDDVRAAAASIAPSVMEQVVSPVIDKLTNNEPWYQSYALVGAGVALVSGLYGLGYDFLDGSIPTPAELTPHLTTVFGSAVVIYGRLFATRPLGA